MDEAVRDLVAWSNYSTEELKRMIEGEELRHERMEVFLNKVAAAIVPIALFFCALIFYYYIWQMAAIFGCLFYLLDYGVERLSVAEFCKYHLIKEVLFKELEKAKADELCGFKSPGKCQ